MDASALTCAATFGGCSEGRQPSTATHRAPESTARRPRAGRASAPRCSVAHMTRRAPDARPDAPALRGHPRLRAYVRESYAVHRRVDLGDGLCAELQAWQLLMTEAGCFTALTSAAVRGWWMPPIPAGTPVFMALEVDDPRPMRVGVRTSRHTREVAREELDGLRCASTPETLLACPRWLCLLDLVVLIDCAFAQGGLRHRPDPGGDRPSATRNGRAVTSAGPCRWTVRVAVRDPAPPAARAVRRRGGAPVRRAGPGGRRGRTRRPPDRRHTPSGQAEFLERVVPRLPTRRRPAGGADDAA